MSYISLRWTFSNNELSDDQARAGVKRWMEKHDLQHEYIMCIECKDKYGKETKRHAHVNIYTDKEIKKDTAQRWFRNYLRETFDVVLSGNRDYSLAVRCPDDEQRWWRYILKEEGAKIWRSENKAQFVKDNKALAIDERKRTIELNNKHLQKYLDKSSVKGKMYQELKKNNIDNHKSFILGAIEYYLGKCMTPPFSKLDDMFVEYKLLVGLMDKEEWYNLKYSVNV